MSGITIRLECAGCDAKAEGTQSLRKEFLSASGRSYGFGSIVWAVRVEDAIPEGWVAFDPYTYMTYCPKCWEEIAPATPRPAAREHADTGETLSPEGTTGEREGR